MNKRQEYNLKIIQKIFALVMEEPDLRFIQALWALGIIDRLPVINTNNDIATEVPLIKDRFYEEPEDTLERMKKLSK